MRALIIKTGGYLDKRVQRIFNNNSIKGDVGTKLTRNMMNVYGCVIFSHKNDIQNLPKLIETIVLEKKLLVVFINSTSSIGQYYNVINDLYFSMVNELSLEIELPLVLSSNTKYVNKILDLENEIVMLKEESKLLKLTNKAKLILMNKGLTESESHKFIQQKAMSMRLSKLKVVNLIIKNKIDI